MTKAKKQISQSARPRKVETVPQMIRAYGGLHATAAALHTIAGMRTLPS
jgi:hypothetical protein